MYKDIVKTRKISETIERTRRLLNMAVKIITVNIKTAKLLNPVSI
jgi:hypothetical protein